MDLLEDNDYAILIAGLSLLLKDDVYKFFGIDSSRLVNLLNLVVKERGC